MSSIFTQFYCCTISIVRFVIIRFYLDSVSRTANFKFEMESANYAYEDTFRSNTVIVALTLFNPSKYLGKPSRDFFCFPPLQRLIFQTSQLCRKRIPVDQRVVGSEIDMGFLLAYLGRTSRNNSTVGTENKP